MSRTRITANPFYSSNSIHRNQESIDICRRLNSAWSIYVPQLKGTWDWKWIPNEKRYIYLFDGDKLPPEVINVMQLLFWNGNRDIPPTPPQTPSESDSEQL